MEFKNIYENKTGQILSFENAQKYAEDIAEVYYILSQIRQREINDTN